MGQNVAELGSGPPRNCPRLSSRADSVANSCQNRVLQCRTLRKSKTAYYFWWVVCINEFRDEAVVWPWWSARSPTERQGSSDHTRVPGTPNLHLKHWRQLCWFCPRADSRRVKQALHWIPDERENWSQPCNTWQDTDGLDTALEAVRLKRHWIQKNGRNGLPMC